MKKSVSTERKGQEPPEQSEKQSLIVGIGASEGGMEALQDFFGQVPADSGHIYVVMLHLSPGHDRQLAALIGQISPLPVQQVTAGTRIEPDHIYVVPSDRHLSIEDNHITPSSDIQSEDRRAPVDIFFRNLAEAGRGHAVGVVLSGTGANGSMGLKRIKEQGGAIFVQNPREAGFNEMPRNAVATGLADEVLNAAEIPSAILTYHQILDKTHIAEAPEGRAEGEQQALRDIFTQLRLRTGHDFSNYKRATLMRRIERRMAVRAQASLSGYAAYAGEHPEETQALLKDLLISVTNFFRDRTPFQQIENAVLPALFSGKATGDQVRIWIAGCATGEEAYSLAMLCAEHTLGMMDAPRVQIFATDIDEAAISLAREGYYTVNDAADVSAERLARFFTREDEGYRIRREIRETVLFSHHNFLKDPPFSRIDLISCRNVLIYLNRQAQERVMETFHFALRPGGFLLLGTSESVDTAHDLFSPFSREHHIYQSRVSPNQRTVMMPEPFYPPTPVLPAAPPLAGRAAVPVSRISYSELHFQLLEEYAPPSLVVNADFDLVHTSPHAGRYLQLSGGEPTQSILKLIRGELRSDLRNGLYQASQQDAPVNSMPLHVRTDQGTENVRIHVRPVRTGDGRKHALLLVVFEQVTDADRQEAIAYASDETAARHLEDEVIRLRTQLRASNEQHEFQAEELKAGNEELQAMNEELRSATEELETSKEELQSINEELSTVNQELKVKVEEATMTSNNLQNLINSTDIGTIFLDRSFRVVLFTPAVRSIFNLIPADYGRPLSDITSRLEQDTLLDDARTVLERLLLIEREARTEDGRIFLTRLAPYRTEEDRIRGVVITFFDITERKRSEEQLRASEEKFRTLFEAMDEGYCIIELLYDKDSKASDWRFLLVNPAFEKHNGLYNATGKTIRELAPDIEQKWIDIYSRVAETGEAIRFEEDSMALNGRIFDLYAFRVGEPDERKVAVLFMNITERRRREINTALLNEISKDLAALSAPDEIVSTVGARIGKYLRVSTCNFMEVNEQGEVTEQHGWHAADVPGPKRDFLLKSPLTGEFTQTGEPVVICNTSRDGHVNAGVYAHMKIGSIVAVPFLRHGRWTAQVTVTTSEPRDWQTDDIGLLQEVANRLFARLERARAEKALSESEERKAYLLKLSDALRPLNSPEEISRGALKIAAEQLSLDRIIYEEISTEEAEQPLSVIFLRDGSAPYTGHVPLHAATYRDQRRKEAAVEDTEQDSRLGAEDREACRRMNIRSFLIIPLVKNGILVCRLIAHCHQPRKWTPYEISLLEETAERTRAEAERARREKGEHESRERLQSIANLVPDLLWASEPDGATNWYNQRWLEYTGQTFGEAVDWGWMNAVHPDDRETSGRRYLKAIEQGRKFRIEHRLRRADGEYHWFVVHAAPLKDSAGRVIRMYGAATDIHESRTVLEALRRSEARLRVTMETAVDYAIINTDTEGIIEGWSRGAERIFGWTEEEVLGKHSSIIFTPEDREAGAPEEEIRLAIRDGRSPDERWHIRKDGSRFYMSGVMRPVYDSTLRGFVKVARDLTEQRNAEEALRVSEERYRVALQSADMAAWDWDIVRDRIRWNDQHFLLFGLEPTDRLVDIAYFIQFLHPEDRAAVSGALMNGVEETGSYRVEAFRIIRTDGKVRWMSGYGRTVDWQNGKSERMVGVMYDITHSVEATMALRDRQLKLEIAQRAARIGIWGFDLATQQGLATPEWNELTGYPDPGETFELETFLSLVHPEDRDKLVAAHNQAVHEQSAIELEFRLQHAARGMLWLLKRGQYIPPYSGMNATLMGSLIDITERKELEQQKEQFIGIASHELRTPVTSIKAYAEILEEIFTENGDAQSSALMQKLDVQIDRLTSLIYALLDTTRITEGKLKLEKADFDIDELIADTAETMQRIAGRQRIELELSTGTTVHADLERVRQVLVNLINNALKYSPDTDRIIVTSATDGQQLTVCVRDFGIGISELAQQQLFTRFFRERETGSFSGLGLGLFISASIIREHGGTISVSSRQGEGALFCFTLPLR